MFKATFKTDKRKINNKLVSKVNQYCPNCSHEHRKASKNEYTQNKLYFLKDTGCYLCNPDINLDTYMISLSWSCLNFTNTIQHKLSLYQKLMFYMITKDDKFSCFLPLELVLIIFKKCEWTEYTNKINKVTPELTEHSRNCRYCAEKIISTNTGFTCSHHIISRCPINRNNHDIDINYNP